MRGKPRTTQSDSARARRGAATGGGRAPRIAAALDAIRRLVRVLRITARQAEDRTGLSPAQLYVLGQIGAMPDCSLSELADRTLTDRTSVRAMVERLAARGLVARETGAADRRRVELRVTAAGRRVLARAPRSPTQHLLAGLEDLDAAALERLVASLGELLVAIGASDEPATMLFEDETTRGTRRPRKPLQ